MGDHDAPADPSEWTRFARGTLTPAHSELAIDEYIERIELSIDAIERAELMAEMAELLELEVQDPERALTLRIAAYREAPSPRAWPHLDRLAELTGRWEELLEEELEAIPDLIAEDRAAAWLRLAELCVERLGSAEKAFTVIAFATESAPHLPEVESYRIELLRKERCWFELSCALEDYQPASIEDEIQRALELGELYEYKLGDQTRAIAAYLDAAELGASEAEVGLERLYRAQEYTAELVDLLERRADRLDPSSAAALLAELAELCERELAQPQRAIAFLRWLTALRPSDPQALGSLERLLGRVGDHRARLDVLVAQIGITPAGPELAALCQRAAGIAERELHDLPRAAELLELGLSCASRCEAVVMIGELTRLYRTGENWLCLVDTLTRHASYAEGERRATLYASAGDVCSVHLQDASTARSYHLKSLDADPRCDQALAGLVRESSDPEIRRFVTEALEHLADTAEHSEREAWLRYRVGQLLEAFEPGSATATFESALALAPQHVESRLALSRCHGANHAKNAAAAVLLDGVAITEDRHARALLLTEAGHLCVECGEVDQAVELYHGALELDQELVEAAGPLADILWDQESYLSLVPVLSALVESTATTESGVERMIRLGIAHREIGNNLESCAVLERAVALDRRPRTYLELVETLIAAGRIEEAIEVLTALEDRVYGELAPSQTTTVSYRLALCYSRLGKPRLAREHLDRVLDQNPDHDPALALQSQLGELDVRAVIHTKRALLTTTPSAEKRAAIHVEIGDLLRKRLEAPAEALDEYRRAQALRPESRRALYGCFEALMEMERWDESIGCLVALAEQEGDPSVRARYLFTAGAICRERLEQDARAAAFFKRALRCESNPGYEAELEELYRSRQDFEALRDYYIEVLQGSDSSASPDRRRSIELWSKLGDLYLEHFDRAEGLVALEVAAKLSDSAALHQRLASLYLESGDTDLDKAIAHEHALVRHSDRIDGHLAALVELYRDTGREHRARACELALEVLARRGLASRPAARSTELCLDDDAALGDHTYNLLRHPSESAVLSSLFAAAAPAMIWGRAHRLDALGLTPGEQVESDAEHPFVAALASVERLLRLPRCKVYAVATRSTPVELVPCIRSGTIELVAVLGKPVVAAGRGAVPLRALLASRLIDSRPERLIRSVIAAPGELSAVVQAAIELGAGDGNSDPCHHSNTHKLLTEVLPGPSLDHIATLGRKMASEGIEPERAVEEWMRATDLTALRMASLTADLETCAGLIERGLIRAGAGDSAERVVRLCREAVAVSMLELRDRLGGAAVPVIEAVA